MGLSGTLVALFFLIRLAYRGGSVLVLAPAAAFLAAAVAREPLLASWTQTLKIGKNCATNCAALPMSLPAIQRALRK